MKKVLIIEDSPDVQEFVTVLISSFGYDAAAVPSRDKALASMAKYEPELLLMDHGMPGMNLDDFLFNVRAEFPNTRIVLYSAENAQAKAQAYGIKYFIAKPFQINELEEILGECFSGGRSSLLPSVRIPATV